MSRVNCGPGDTHSCHARCGAGCARTHARHGSQRCAQSVQSEGEEEGEGEDGWERVLDPTTGREYFWHNVTDEVRWTEPPELAVNQAAEE